ncbi:hypothetical protein NECAME_15249, partial [Necator americanus]
CVSCFRSNACELLFGLYLPVNSSLGPFRREWRYFVDSRSTVLRTNLLICCVVVRNHGALKCSVEHPSRSELNNPRPKQNNSIK